MRNIHSNARISRRKSKPSKTKSRVSANSRHSQKESVTDIGNGIANSASTHFQRPTVKSPQRRTPNHESSKPMEQSNYHAFTSHLGYAKSAQPSTATIAHATTSQYQHGQRPREEQKATSVQTAWTETMTPFPNKSALCTK